MQQMIGKMAKMFPMMILMGFMIVVVSLIVGFVNSQNAAVYFAESKAVREAAAAGSAFVDANVTSHVLEAWVPQFKFVGLGLGLMAITMALGVIAKRLRQMGQVITSHMPADLRPHLPAVPTRVRVFQLSTMMGIMVLLAALVIGIILATGVVPDYWNHSIANELNQAQVGSGLLNQLRTVSSFASWLNPLRMVGMAFLFTGITIALTVIIGSLLTQAKLLSRFYQEASARV